MFIGSAHRPAAKTRLETNIFYNYQSTTTATRTSTIRCWSNASSKLVGGAAPRYTAKARPTILRICMWMRC